MIWLAIASILVNGLSALSIRKYSHDNINIRSAYLHLFGDMLTSVAVLAGGLAIKFLKWNWTDSVFSLVIALYLVWVSWGIFRSSLRIIMQFTPEEIEIKKIACEIEKIHGVKNIHHVHVWQINDHDLMFEAHVDMSEDYKMSGFEKVLEEIKLILDQNGINHSTIQPEFSVDDKKQIIY
jgi:cobalt-zinc-cadmium efflux system protein